ncbi:MAG: hypothetical protein R6V31_11635 [Halohasta sp.]
MRRLGVLGASIAGGLALAGGLWYLTGSELLAIVVIAMVIGGIDGFFGGVVFLSLEPYTDRESTLSVGAVIVFVLIGLSAVLLSLDIETVGGVSVAVLGLLLIAFGNLLIAASTYWTEHRSTEAAGHLCLSVATVGILVIGETSTSVDWIVYGLCVVGILLIGFERSRIWRRFIAAGS